MRVEGVASRHSKMIQNPAPKNRSTLRSKDRLITDENKAVRQRSAVHREERQQQSRRSMIEMFTELTRRAGFSAGSSQNDLTKGNNVKQEKTFVPGNLHQLFALSSHIACHSEPAQSAPVWGPLFRAPVCWGSSRDGSARDLVLKYRGWR